MHSPSFLARITQRLALLAAALVYIAWIIARQPLTRHARVDGIIGVLGGLYICSHPATSFVDLLFFGRHSNLRLSNSELGTWLTLNLLVFLGGVLMITTGATRFV